MDNRDQLTAVRSDGKCVQQVLCLGERATVNIGIRARRFYKKFLPGLITALSMRELHVRPFPPARLLLRKFHRVTNY